MPIFYNKDSSVLFVHIPKCGGTSLELAIQKSGYSIALLDSGIKSETFKFWKCSPQHFHYKMLNSFVNVESIKFKFAIVRNPYDRIISEYVMRNKNVNIDKRPNMSSWIKNIFSRFKKNNYILDNHIRPQVDFIHRDMHIYKLEDGLSQLYLALETANFYIDKNKISHVKHYSSVGLVPKDIHLSEDDKYLIYEFYKEDFNALGYSK